MRDDQYFYVLPADVLGGKLWLRGDEARHCTKVLRKTIGDAFFAVDGLGHEYAVSVARVEKAAVECIVEGVKLKPTELPFHITLAQALIKKDHFDLVAEKTTELGVHTLIPMKTARSVPDPGANSWFRWGKILVTAMKQSRRSVLPVLQELTVFEKIITNSDEYDVKIIFHERSDLPFPAYARECLSKSALDKVLLLIGPEGGFTESETALAVEHGFISLSLGARRLRAETAAISALTLFSNVSCR